jgi:SRSO17 transposase
MRRLTEFVTDHNGAFRRSDQLRWAAVYLLGLLQADGRRNIESLARAIAASALSIEEDIPQGLGHFLTHSPWDESIVWLRAAERVAGLDGLFVLEEMTFPKQGRHSVGVHRQHSRTLGRKANCQLAVALYHVNDVAVPLGIRLYLPRAWQSDAERIAAAGVPAAHQVARDRAAIGQELLRAARDAGVRTSQVAGGLGWVWSDHAAEVLGEGGFRIAELSPEVKARLDRTRQRLEVLGLGHFEGRLWRGFHHHTCLVALAESFERSTARVVEVT